MVEIGNESPPARCANLSGSKLLIEPQWLELLRPNNLDYPAGSQVLARRHMGQTGFIAQIWCAHAAAHDGVFLKP
jgi:hypothetical protein